MGPSGLQWNFNESRSLQAVRLLYRVTNQGSRDVGVMVFSSGATGIPIWPSRDGAEFPLKANETRLGIYEIRAGGQGGSAPFIFRFVIHGRDEGCSVARWEQTIAADNGRAGEKARPGVGVLVHTAGFWENGTLFYTNIDRIHNDTRIPRGGWYEYTNGDPLRVYIYNTTGRERPPRYNGTSNGYWPPNQPKPPVYSNTIQGFNDALKTMQTTGSWIVHIPPEKAYTIPERRGHRLYGDALIFYIQLRDVTAINCPVPEPACDPVLSPPRAPAPAPQTHPLIFLQP